MLFIIFTPKDIFSPFLHSFFLLNEMEKKEREKNMERQKRKKTRKKITAKISLNSSVEKKIPYFDSVVGGRTTSLQFVFSFFPPQ